MSASNSEIDKRGYVHYFDFSVSKRLLAKKQELIPKKQN